MNQNREMQREQPSTYPSGIDGWIGFALVGVPLGLFAAFAARALPAPGGSRLLVLVLLAGLSGLLLWFLLATSYRVDAATLTVRSGPLRWVIALARIESITPTRDASSGPALSMDRLRISYDGGRQILVSPRDQQGFVREIERRRRELGNSGAGQSA